MPWKESNVVTLREEFVMKALKEETPFEALCVGYGVSRKTGYKWLARFKTGGLGGLRNQSKRPLTSPGLLSEHVTCDLISIKIARPSWGPKKVLSVYERTRGEGPCLSSVKRIFDRCGLVVHRRRQRKEDPMRVQERLVPQKSNELWTVDFKGWWKTRNGEHCEPLTVRDSFSRFLLDLRALDGTSEKVVRPVFENIFENFGLPEAIRSDNGSPFASYTAPLGLSRLSAWWVSLGIRLDRIDPGRPDQNGAHERIHRDIRAELQVRPAEGGEESQALFDEWRKTFNWERPHEALSMKMPGEIYTRSERSYDARPVEVTYSIGWMERRVSSSGTIRLCSSQMRISEALAGFTVGLQPIENRLDVWFDYLKLGHIDLHQMKFIPLVKEKRCRPTSWRLAARR